MIGKPCSAVLADNPPAPAPEQRPKASPATQPEHCHSQHSHLRKRKRPTDDLEQGKRTALRCGDEVVLPGANDSGDTIGATQGKRQLLKGTKSASMQVGDGEEGWVAVEVQDLPVHAA